MKSFFLFFREHRSRLALELSVTRWRNMTTLERWKINLGWVCGETERNRGDIAWQWHICLLFGLNLFSSLLFFFLLRATEPELSEWKERVWSCYKGHFGHSLSFSLCQTRVKMSILHNVFVVVHLSSLQVRRLRTATHRQDSSNRFYMLFMHHVLVQPIRTNLPILPSSYLLLPTIWKIINTVYPRDIFVFVPLTPIA